MKIGRGKKKIRKCRTVSVIYLQQNLFKKLIILLYRDSGYEIEIISKIFEFILVSIDCSTIKVPDLDAG